MMKNLIRILLIHIILFTAIQFQLTAQNQYHDYKSMLKWIQSLPVEYPQSCSSSLLAKTAGGKEIWVISIGSGNRDSKPGIAVFGGVEGRHILGRELAMGFAASLLNESATDDIKALLDKITFYVFPDLTPDASEQFFSNLKYERTGNARSTDEDHDFVFDEDGFEDLNNDGLITQLRIMDPSGIYIKSNEDERVMTEADIAKGQSGNYLVYSEGIDNDKDGSFNEDGPGGVNFNRNFTYNYDSFGPEAGLYPVSEPEAKAVADFLFDKFNIYAVFIYGPQDNLGQPWKYAPDNEKNSIIRSVMKEDEPIFNLVSDKYHEITGVAGSPSSENGRGNFMDWSYFHYGRYCFSTPAWWFKTEKEKNREAAFLKYAEDNNLGNIFVAWTPVNHPDFPGKSAEVGGIQPFAMLNPPPDSLKILISKNYKFIIAIAGMHPELEFLDIETENTGDGINRISLQIHNKGIFATLPKIGEENMWTRIMRISVEPLNGQEILSGRKIQQVERLAGNQSAEFSWLLKGKGAVKISAGALNTGSVTSTIELR